VEAKLQDLRSRLLEVDNLRAAAAVLRWDQTTYLPPGGAPARARQLAMLGRTAHEKFTDPALGALLEDLPACASRPAEQNDARQSNATPAT
jgi:carboxypeptidase Taq